jgi:hypothetical protein
MNLPFPDAPPNFLSIAVQSRALGQADRKAKVRDNALGMMATDPEGAKNALMGVGDFETANAVDQQIQQQTRKKVLGQYATDPTGAESSALQAGDPELIAAVSKLDENQRAVAHDHAQTVAAIGVQLLNAVPGDAPEDVAKRKAAIQAMKQSFVDRKLLTPEQVDAFVPTRANIQAVVGQAMSLTELLKQNEPFTLSPGQKRFGADGREVASVADKPEYRTVTNADGTSSVVAVGGAEPSSSGPLDMSNPGHVLQGIIGSPVTVTSTRRTPEHNAEVGGVPNSDHLSGHAVDFVPKGMSTADAAAKLKATGKFSQVLDEGDHVHASWSGAGASQASRVIASGSGGGDALLSDDDAEFTAQMYLTSGQMPPLGQGKVGSINRKHVLTKAREMSQATGMTGADAAANYMANKVAFNTLKNAQNLRSMTEGYETTALKSADIAMSLAPKGTGPTGRPVLDKWIQAGRKGIGDADVVAFNNALDTMANEYAKVISMGTGNQAATDSARAEAHQRFNHAFNMQQLQAAVDVMKREMEARTSTLKEKEAQARSSIGIPSKRSGSAQAGQKITTRSGAVVVVTPDG